MTVVIIDDRLSFEFPDGWDASKYDDWDYYKNQFMSLSDGTKAVDIVAMPIDGPRTLWLIEIKDYRDREHASSKVHELAEEVGKKVKDTLAGLAAARLNSSDKTEELSSIRARNAHEFQVVLHIEQPVSTSRLFPTVIDKSKLQQKLRMRLKSIDPAARVVDQHSLSASMNWIVKG